jgi:hypothetical protein
MVDRSHISGFLLRLMSIALMGTVNLFSFKQIIDHMLKLTLGIMRF